MNNETNWIGAVLLMVFTIASITTAIVLSFASTNGGTVSWLTSFKSGPSEMPDESQKKKQDRATNVVLIILDDAGWADFSHHNTDPWSALATPNIDTILKEGLSFSNFHTQSLCTPARGAMMTGRWTWALGLQYLMVFRTCMDARLDWEIPTWAELLHEREYKNYYYGKWHLGSDSWKSTAKGRGWDNFLGPLNTDYGSGGGQLNGNGVWVGLYDDWNCDQSLADEIITAYSSTECMFRSYDYRYVDYSSEASLCYAFHDSTLATACTDANIELETMSYNDQYIDRNGSFVHLYLDEHAVDWYRDFEPANPFFQKHGDVILTDEALERLKTLSAEAIEKWSIVLSYKTPHQDTSFLPNGTNTPVVASCQRFFNEGSRYYSYDRGAICQQMWQIDIQVGRIVKALQKLNLWDNTLLMLTNDNGASSAQYTEAKGLELNYNYGLNWPFRGVKSSYYQGAVKTIMGITGGALPDSERGVENDNLHHISDIAPTILAATGWSDAEMLGASNGYDFDGIPLYASASAGYTGHDYIFLSAPSFPGESEWEDNITAIVLSNGLKFIKAPTVDDLNSRGYWGTLPRHNTIKTTWESCDDGCMWDLVQDPYEHNNITNEEDWLLFNNLLEEAMASPTWHDGLRFDQAACDICTMNRDDCENDSGIRYFGCLYYPPWH